VIYVWSDDEPGQFLGVPWLTAVLLRMDDGDQLSNAQLVRQKVAAMWAAIVTRAFGTPDDDPDEIELAPGQVQYLEPGEAIEFGSPPDAGGYMDVSTVNSREVAAGIGVTYEDMTGDYSHVTYSSARMGALVSRGLIDQWQAELMIARFCSPLGRWLLEAAEFWDAYIPVDAWGDGVPVLRWTPPRRELLDPSGEVTAAAASVASGFTSRSEEIRRQGADPAEVDAERAADAAREAEMTLGVGGDLQTSALSGAQVVSMVGVLSAVAMGQLPAESATRILMRSFQMSRRDAEAMVSPADEFEPTGAVPVVEPTQQAA
jgi:lambda family phage portal protein